jgi:ribosome-associated protein
MDDMSRSNAMALCRILEDRGAGYVVGLELGPHCSWATHLVIGTVTSNVHMQGLGSAIHDFFSDLGMNTRNSTKRSNEGSWRMIDGGEIVVSLMDKEAREYYALEERWFESNVIFRGEAGRSSRSS